MKGDQKNKMRKKLCPECKGELSFLSRKRILAADMYIWVSNYECTWCKIIWNHYSLLNLWEQQGIRK